MKRGIFKLSRLGVVGLVTIVLAMPGAVAAFTPTVNTFPLGAGSDVYQITTGPDGNLWFTESSGNKIGKVTAAGSFTEYAVPTPSSTPWGLTAGPDGNLWFAEALTTNFGRITPRARLLSIRLLPALRCG